MRVIVIGGGGVSKIISICLMILVIGTFIWFANKPEKEKENYGKFAWDCCNGAHQVYIKTEGELGSMYRCNENHLTLYKDIFKVDKTYRFIVVCNEISTEALEWTPPSKNFKTINIEPNKPDPDKEADFTWNNMTQLKNAVIKI